MATAEAPATRPAGKNEVFVARQLRRALRRIRTFDIAAACCGFLIVSLLYGLALMLLDAWLVIPSLGRQLAFGCYVALAVVYVFRLLVWPLWRDIDLHYAAVQLEHIVPGCKNSLVNWIDLRDQQLPPAIRAAVSARAARDLAKADLDQAISGKHVLWLGSGVGALLLATILIFSALGPRQFFSLLQRTFTPFTETSVLTRTEIVIVEPAGGNATVAVNQAVNFVVAVRGRVPRPDERAALRLQFRYGQNEPVYQERLLTPGDADRQWTYRLPGFEVQNGFFYRIAGGDFRTEEYQVQARSGPVITRFQATCKFRPYLRKPDLVSNEPNLLAERGTEVSLLVNTNRPVREGRLLIEPARQGVEAEPVTDDPLAMRFRFVLDQEGSYRIRFTAGDGETVDSVSYSIRVLADAPPKVQLTDPAHDSDVPANSVQQLKGQAKDDHGITAMRLQVRMQNGTALLPKPYRPGQFKFDDGGYPGDQEYQDVLKLDQLKTQTGAPQLLKPGDVIEYWLEATDNCDYPDPAGQVGKSDVYKIRVGKPVDKKQEQKDNQQAQEQQKQHQQKQDEKHKQQNEERKQQADKPPADQPKADPPPDRKKDEQAQQDRENQKKFDDLNKQLDEKKGEAKSESAPEAKGANRDKDNPNNQGKGSEQGKGEAKGPKPDDGKEQKSGPGPDPQQGQQGQTRPQPKDGGQGAGESHQPKTDPRSPQGDKKAGPGKGPGDSKQGSDTPKSAPPSDTKTKGKDDNAKGTDTAGKTPAQDPPNGKTDKGGSGSTQSKQGKHVEDERPVAGLARGDQGPPPKGDSRGALSDQPKGEAHKAPGKEDGPAFAKASDKGQQRPAPGSKAEGAGEARGDGPRPNQAADHARPGADPMQEIDALARATKDLKSKNEDKQAEARKQLEQLSKNAGDPKVREQANKALKDDQQGPGAADSAKGDDPKNKTTGNAGKNGKEQPQASAGNGSAGKTEPKQSGKTDSAGPPTPNPGDPTKQGTGSNSTGQQTPPQRPDQGKPTAGTPGGPGGAPGAGERPQQAGGAADNTPGIPADPDHRRRAGELQLEQLRKKVTPEMLKKANMTPEEFERFIQSYRDLLRRQAAQEKEKLAPPQQGDAKLPNPGVRRTAGADGKSADAHGANAPQVPPEFRNAYREFTEELSKLKK